MFSLATFDFLDTLSHNNNRQWFEEHKGEYEARVRQPALDFIEDMAAHLTKFAPNFRAAPKKVGGSLMRVYRDTRFSHNKTPYKTNIGIQFRHALGKDIHAPGFYLHIASDECFIGAGCWHPQADALAKIRCRIAEHPAEWFAARDDRSFNTQFKLAGSTLIRPPKGYLADHVAITDLKRKDFIALSSLTKEDIISNDLIKIATTRFRAATPMMKFLCASLNAPF